MNFVKGFVEVFNSTAFGGWVAMLLIAVAHIAAVIGIVFWGVGKIVEREIEEAKKSR